MSTQSWAGDFCLRPDSPGQLSKAGDSGLQGPETPVHDLVSAEDEGWMAQTPARRLLSLAGDSDAVVT
jgi:hypothetical protein